MDFINRKKRIFLDVGQGSGSLDKKSRKKIFLSVLYTHLALALIPLLWYTVQYFFIAKKPLVIQVTLVTPDDAVSSPIISPPINKPKTTKPKTTNKPKTVPPRTKPKWKPRKAKSITISKKVIRNKSKPAPPKISASDIEAKLRKSYKPDTSNVSFSKLKTSKGNISQRYQDKISAAIYQLWRQPGKNELHGKFPVTDVEITIDTNGNVVNSRIAQKSGISVMDISVKRLLSELKKLPRPPNGKMTLTISLEIIE